MDNSRQLMPGTNGRLDRSGVQSFPWGTPGVYQGAISYRGYNSGDISVLRVDTDLEAVAAWMADVGRRSQNTAQKYRLEADRLLLWASQEKGLSLSDLGVEHLIEYHVFLTNPGEDWVMNKPHRRSNPCWRPFSSPLSIGSAAHSMTIINSLFSYLMEKGWIRANPCPRVTRKAPKANPTLKSLSRAHFSHLINTVSSREIDEADPAAKVFKARDRWMLCLFNEVAARVAETQHTFGSIKRILFNDSYIWVWDVLGKGEQSDMLPVSNTFISELMAFRTALSLPGLPIKGDPVPLIPSLQRLRSNGTLPGDRLPRACHRSTLYRRVKALLREASTTAEAAGLDKAPFLEASVHWLRHTSLTHIAIEEKDVRKVRKMGRHKNIQTSANYIQVGMDEMVALSKKRKTPF